MAKLVKSYKGFKIKENGYRDNNAYKYSVYNREGSFEWDCDTIEEAMEWIDSC